MDFERIFQALMATVAEGVLLLDPDGRIFACNAAATRMLGFPESALLGRTLHDPRWQAVAVDGQRLSDAAHPLRSMQREGAAPPDLAAPDPIEDTVLGLRRPDGDRVWVRLNARAVAAAGRPEAEMLVVALTDISELIDATARLQQRHDYDPLTGLPGRRLFFEALQSQFRQAAESHEAAAVIELDIDRYQSVNERYGHAVGDALLLGVAKRLRRATTADALVARLGGDEFAVLQPGAGTPGRALRHARQLLTVLRRPFQVAGVQLGIDANLGVALCSGREDGPDEVLDRAAFALQQAKRDGPGRCIVFDSVLDSERRRLQGLGTELRQALAAGQLAVAYQPIIDLRNDRVAGAEALLRWHHPERGMIAPADFIPVAEESGLILQIGDWLLEQALAQLAQWRRRRADFRLSLNLSPRQLEAPHFWPRLRAMMSSAGVSPDSLLLELTETAVMHRLEESGERLRDFASLGASIAIDDFGTGFSSLTYLQYLPVSHVKIDPTFIRQVPLERASRALVEAIVALSERLELDVIAEGIEEEVQAEYLRRLGCAFGQGFLFERPVSVQQFDAYLNRSGANGAA